LWDCKGYAKKHQALENLCPSTGRSSCVRRKRKMHQALWKEKRRKVPAMPVEA
jgi:hypothetical protein